MLLSGNHGSKNASTAAAQEESFTETLPCAVKAQRGLSGNQRKLTENHCLETIHSNISVSFLM